MTWTTITGPFSPFADQDINDVTVRVVIPLSEISSNAPITRLNLKTFGILGNIDEMYIGEQSPSGSDYDFATTPENLVWLLTMPLPNLRLLDTEPLI